MPLPALSAPAGSGGPGGSGASGIPKRSDAGESVSRSAADWESPGDTASDVPQTPTNDDGTAPEVLEQGPSAAHIVDGAAGVEAPGVDSGNSEDHHRRRLVAVVADGIPDGPGGVDLVAPAVAGGVAGGAGLAGAVPVPAAPAPDAVVMPDVPSVVPVAGAALIEDDAPGERPDAAGHLAEDGQTWRAGGTPAEPLPGDDYVPVVRPDDDDGPLGWDDDNDSWLLGEVGDRTPTDRMSDV